MQEFHPSKLDIAITTNDEKSYTMISFTGDLDKYGLSQVKDKIEEIVTNLQQKNLVFDFSNLHFINSESIGFLLTLHSRLLKKEETLMILKASQNVRDVLEVIGIFKIIPYCENMESLEKSLKK